MDDMIRELLEFFEKASSMTYAGDGEEVEPHRPGFIELRFDEGPWSYRDSYCGRFQSWGQEVIWRDGKVFWTQLYGGGMEPEFHGNKDLDSKTFNFLKKAMRTGDKAKVFQPRGPKKLVEGEWEYSCDWEGDITKFRGSEEIRFRGKVVFTHWFFGGLCNWG